LTETQKKEGGGGRGEPQQIIRERRKRRKKGRMHRKIKRMERWREERMGESGYKTRFSS
jgi:hypothetical protein